MKLRIMLVGLMILGGCTNHPPTEAEKRAQLRQQYVGFPCPELRKKHEEISNAIQKEEKLRDTTNTLFLLNNILTVAYRSGSIGYQAESPSVEQKRLERSVIEELLGQKSCFPLLSSPK